MLDPTAQSWLNDLYDSVRDREEGYYEDSVTLLSLLVMSRNYWTPEAIDIFSDGFESGDTSAWSDTAP